MIRRELREKDGARILAGYQPDIDIDFIGSKASAKTFNRILTHVTDHFFMSLFHRIRNKTFKLNLKRTPFSDTGNTEYVETEFVVR
jgi:hypothetical protein